MRSKKVELIVRQLEGLPTLPVVAARVFQAATSEDASVRDIVALIENDQSLTAKILSMTRKTHLGLGKSVATVQKAVVLMGLEAIKNAVLSIQVYEAFGPDSQQGGDAGGFDRLEFWKHCLAVASAAQLLAERIPDFNIDPNEAFVCGLLHDVGKVVFDTCLPKSFARVVQIARTSRVNIADVERRILGLDHAAIGKKLAEHWQLPQTVLHSIWLHHHKSAILPTNIPYRELIDVVHLADLIAREQRVGFSGNFIFIDQSESLARELGVSSESYQELVMDLPKLMGERAAVIGLDSFSTEEIYQRALQGANGELGRLNQSLTVINRKLQSRNRCFDAINMLNRQLRPGMPIVETLEHIASAIRKGLDLPGVVVYRDDTEHGFLEAAFCDEQTTSSEMFQVSGLAMESADAVPAETVLIDPPAYLEPVITHFGKKLGRAEIKLVPLTGTERIIGGVLLGCDTVLQDRIAREKQGIEALTTSCRLALGQALMLETKDQMANDLLTTTRQMQELEQKLLESKYLAAMGELAAGAAHELNNPLAIISGRAQLIRDGEEDPDKHKALEIIIDNSHRASEIVSELMDFARPIRPQRQVGNLKELLEGIASSFIRSNEMNDDQASVEIGPGATSVYCDLQQMTETIKELMANATQAAGKDRVKLQFRTVAEDDPRFVQIRMKDNGPGMEPDVLNKALDLFFSSQKAGRKRGLGLSRVYRYIQANDGIFWLESQVGMGTTAYIRLPSRPASGTN